MQWVILLLLGFTAWGPYDPTHVYEVEWTGDGTFTQHLVDLGSSE